MRDRRLVEHDHIVLVGRRERDRCRVRELVVDRDVAIVYVAAVPLREFEQLWRAQVVDVVVIDAQSQTQRFFDLAEREVLGQSEAFRWIRLHVVVMDCEGSPQRHTVYLAATQVVQITIAQSAVQAVVASVSVLHEATHSVLLTAVIGQLPQVVAQQRRVLAFPQGTARRVELSQKLFVARSLSDRVFLLASGLEHPLALVLELDEEVAREPAVDRDHLVVQMLQMGS